MTDHDPITAGRFAQLTLLSPKALRIYADRGLLVPERIDPANGYRLYGGDQVSRGWLIGLLRSADLSLDQIGAILDGPESGAVERLDAAVATVRRRHAAQQLVLDRARLHLQQEMIMTGPHDPAVATTPSPVISSLARDTATLSVLRRMRPEEMDDVIGAEVRRLRAYAEAHGLSVAGDPYGVFHASITDDADGPLEITLPVDALTEIDAATDPDLTSRRATGGLVAQRYAEGAETDFPAVLALYDEVHSWIVDHGGVPVGPPREVWHNSPGDPEPLRLTVAWPYAVDQPADTTSAS